MEERTSEAPRPVGIARISETALRIDWSDGQARVYQAGELRRLCPCATCREKHSATPKGTPGLTVLSDAEAATISDGGVRIAAMRPVGAYAYHIDFTDGHNTGLYTFEFLSTLGEQMPSDET